MQRRRRAKARTGDFLRQMLRRAGYLPVAALCVGLLGCSSMTSEAGSGVPAMERVEVTPAVWLPAASIAWPDPADPAVHVYYTPDAAIRELELPASVEGVLHAGKDSIFMGQQGNKLAVLFQRPEFVSDSEVRAFIALHESFHLAAQFYGGAVGFSRTTGTSVPENKRSTDAYWHAVKRAVAAPMTETRSAHCSLLEERYEALSDADRKFVVDRAFWEWPAEYFARSRINGYDNPQRYHSIRRRMSEGDELYVVGSDAMGRVASIYGEDRSWEARIGSGESALNVVLEVLGCPQVPDDPGLVKVEHVDFVSLD